MLPSTLAVLRQMLQDQPSVNYENFFDRWHVPEALGYAVLVLAICLALVPLFAGRRLGPFEIPDFPPQKRWLSGVSGVVLLVIASLAYQPLWPVPPLVLFDCGFFSDDYGLANQWQRYELSRDKGRRLWVACQGEARTDLQIAGIRTTAGFANWFFVGYSHQNWVQDLHLVKGESNRLAVVIEPEKQIEPASKFKAASEFQVLMADGRPPVSISLPPLR